jgi:hypothetical protein
MGIYGMIVKKKIIAGNRERKKLNEKAEALSPIEPLDIPDQKYLQASYNETPSKPGSTTCLDQLIIFPINRFSPTALIIR